MRLGLYCLGRITRRALVAFVALEVVFGLVTVLEITHQEPILGGWAVLAVTPILWAYAAVPIALAALAAGVAGSFAEFGHEGELTTAAAAGIGPRTWIVPVVLLGLAVTPWTLHGMAEVMPVMREAQSAEKRLLLRSPEVCLRLLAADPALLPGHWLSLRPRENGRFEDLWLVEVGDGDLPQMVWRAREGTVSVPAFSDSLRLELEDVSVWHRGRGGKLDIATAAEMVLERPVPELARTVSPNVVRRARERTLSELSSAIDQSPPGLERDRARGELAGRLVLALAPVPLLLAAVALGLATARRGAWAGTLAGIALVGAFVLPAQTNCTRWISAGAPLWLAAAPALVLLAASIPTLRSWRTR